MSGLTLRQAAFAREFVASGSARAAASRAGYAQSVADNAGREILGSDAVKQAVSELRREVQERTAEILAGAAQRAAEVLTEIAQDESAPATARIRACVEVLERGGVLEFSHYDNRQADLLRFLDLDDEDALR